MQLLERTTPVAHRNPPLLPRLQERFEQKFMAHWQSHWGGKPILHGSNPGPNSIRLDGNDYLGIARLSATLEVVRGCDAERVRLHANTRRLRASLLDMGCPIYQGSQQIIALETGTEPATMVLRDELEAHLIFGAIFCAPATSRNRAMVRLTLNAGLTPAEMDRIEHTVRTLLPVLKPWDWPIARRARTEQV
jgi:CAI-1 autoinducer synthase